MLPTSLTFVALFLSLISYCSTQTSPTSSSRSISTSASVSSSGTVETTATSVTATTSSIIATPSTNLTSYSDTTLTLFPPDRLVACEYANFAFTGPPSPKTAGVFVTNTSVFLEQIVLGPAFTPLEAGTFRWLCDLPPGLHVQIQMYVTINGSPQYSSSREFVVQSSKNVTCLASGLGQDTTSIVSYASSLLPSYTYKPPKTGGGSSSAGPIAGGVIGGLVFLAVASFSVLLFLRRRRRSIAPLLAEKGPQESTGYWPGVGPFVVPSGSARSVTDVSQLQRRATLASQGGAAETVNYFFYLVDICLRWT
ncbi:hypothetical protein T439DRAFT_218269 [Meredithblackwellia eburnea MCA 4105]